jgi:hypothetical protein
MMRKYRVENVNDHFIAFNTICDATQVIFVFFFQHIRQFPEHYTLKPYPSAVSLPSILSI